LKAVSAFYDHSMFSVIFEDHYLPKLLYNSIVFIMNEKEDTNRKEIKQKEESLGERLKLEKNGRLCRCGKSKKYPYCDGSHSSL